VKIAILSDVHGNLEALQAVLSRIEALGCDTLLSLGDAVGYGPEPRACVDILRRRAEINLLGNHDAAVTGATPLDLFNPHARTALEWTRGMLDDRDVSFLASLPVSSVHARGEAHLVHASPRDPEKWNYIATAAHAAGAFAFFEERICFVGHSHVPLIVFRGKDGTGGLVDESGTVLDEDLRYIVNTGSVGQPRDGDPRASFALFDTAGPAVEIHRASYDVERTQELMRDCGLPAFLVERLAVGR